MKKQNTMPRKKFIAGTFGFLAGVVTAPLALLAWPVMLAMFMYSEADEGLEVAL